MADAITKSRLIEKGISSFAIVLIMAGTAFASPDAAAANPMAQLDLTKSGGSLPVQIIILLTALSFIPAILFQ